MAISQTSIIFAELFAYNFRFISKHLFVIVLKVLNGELKHMVIT